MRSGDAVKRFGQVSEILALGTTTNCRVFLAPGAMASKEAEVEGPMTAKCSDSHPGSVSSMARAGLEREGGGGERKRKSACVRV